MRVGTKKRIVFIIFAIAVISIILCIKNRKTAYGNDLETIQSEFPNISGIESCYYKTERIGNPFFDFIGPTNYHLTAVIIIDSDEMEKITKQYEGEKRDKLNENEQIKIEIENRLVENTGIENETVWTFNQEFRMNVLGSRYVGEVYYLEEENVIYVDVENL